MYSIWLQNSIHNDKIYNLIERYAREEKKDSFFPHVTLVSKINSHEKFIDKHGFKFPLIADTDEKLCRSLDVIKEKSLYGRKYMGVDRSTFIIDITGKILHSWRAVKVKGHVEEVLAKLKELS